MKTVTLAMYDEKGTYKVRVPFEAVEQLYGELGLSPGVGGYKFEVDGQACACGVGVLKLAKSAGPVVADSIRTMAFDQGGRGQDRGVMTGPDLQLRQSHALGRYFHDRLGGPLPDKEKP